MASKRIDVNVNGKDNTSSAFKSVATNISKLNAEAGKAGTTIGSSIGKGAQTASTSIGKLGSTASSAFQKIASGASSAGKSIASSFDGISGALAGVAGGYGAMSVAQAAWSGAVQQDFNKQFLATKVGTAQANAYVKSIQDIVAVVPGPDSWMNNLLSGAVAKQTNLSSAELKTLADMSASYYLTATGMGKSSIETQNDLNEYIKTGNTSQLERDSILKDQLPLLEGQATVSDRIAALQKAMVADGYDQVSNLQTLGNKWETVSGLIGKAATSLGNAFAPALNRILDFVMKLDGQTGGLSTTIGLIGVAIFGIVTALAAAAGPIKALLSPWPKIASGIVDATKALWKYVVAAKAADKADDGVGTKGGATTGSKGGGVAGAATIIAGGLAAVGVADLVTQHIVTPIYDTVGKAFGGGESFKAYGTIADWLGLGNDKPVENYNQKVTDMARQNGANIQTMDQQWATLKSQVMGLGTSISSVGINAGNSFRNAMTSAVAGITGAWNGLKSLVGQGVHGVVTIVGPTISAIRGAVSSLWGLVRQGASGVVRIFSSGLDSVRSAVSSLYNTVRAGATGIVTTIRNIIGGPGGPRGPAGALSNISFKYENYGGWQKDAWTGGNSMSGNCADMTQGLINRFGGSYVSGTWNGNPHVWWKSPSGQEFDPARYALNGTGSPPPRGPSAAASGTNFIIQGDVYGWEDFVGKVAQATGSMTKDIRRMV